MKIKKSDLVFYAVIIILFSFFTGYMIGYGAAINKIVVLAKPYIDINEAALREAVHRLGL